MGTSVKAIFDAQKAAFRVRFPDVAQVRNIRTYDGRFEERDLKDASVDPPEIFLSNLGGPAKDKGGGAVDHYDSWVIIIAARQTDMETDETKTAPYLATETCLLLSNQRWGIDGNLIELPVNINSVPVAHRSDGLILWAITYDQPFRTGAIKKGTKIGYNNK